MHTAILARRGRRPVPGCDRDIPSGGLISMIEGTPCPALRPLGLEQIFRNVLTLLYKKFPHGDELMTLGKIILVVDDDPAMRRLIGEYLGQHGFRLYLAPSGDEMSRILSETPVDLIVLDMKLGEEDGLSLLRDLRSRSEVPIIVLTGSRREEVDRIIGLELGADDYVLKPFSMRELLARIRAVLRRAEIRDALHDRNEKRTLYRFGDWVLNLRMRRLTAPGGAPIGLTNGEFSLLAAFVRAPQRVLSREQLLTATRMHEDVFDRTVDAQILRLRRKLEADPSHPVLIRTERGAEYIFTAPVLVS
jgi:two-component system OmpR family response regulator